MPRVSFSSGSYFSDTTYVAINQSQAIIQRYVSWLPNHPDLVPNSRVTFGFSGQGKTDRPDPGSVLSRGRPGGAGAGANPLAQDAGEALAAGGDDLRPSSRCDVEVPSRAEVSAAGDFALLLFLLLFFMLFFPRYSGSEL